MNKQHVALSKQGSLVFCSVPCKLFLVCLKTLPPDSGGKFAVAAAGAGLGLDSMLSCLAGIVLVFI